MSLMHNIRNFAETKLQGVIPWSKFSFPDTEHTDVSNVAIEGKNGSYHIVVSSSYAVPPLGRVQFKDLTQGHEFEGQNQDDMWHRVAEYLKVRESGEAYTVTDADPRNAALAAEIASGILGAPALVAKMPYTPPTIPPVAFVFYISDPGVWYQNGPALVTRVNADGSYNLTVFPDGSEPFYRQNVGQQSDVLKNVCWVAYPSALADADPSDTAIDVSTEIADLKTAVAELMETLGRIKASAFDQRKSA